MMNSAEIRDLMGELQSVALEMDSEQLGNAHKACAVIEDLTLEKCRDVIRLAGKGPVLQCFMSDGWSCDMRERVGVSHGGIRVDRRGRMRTEFVLQRAILKCRRGDQWHLAVKVQRPRPLASKKCENLWTAACDFAPVLALSGHSGVGIHVYLQDGLFAKPFARFMTARHCLFWDSRYCPLTFLDDADRQLAELKDWVYCLRCLAHSCSLALKWGLRSHVLGGADMLEGIHISVSSLLRASKGLFLVVPEFLATYVVLDLPQPENFDDIQFFWTCLDVPPKLIDLFLKVNPVWKDGKLHCSALLSGDPDMVSAVTTVIHFCLHWVDFSETRWTKVGVCGRLFLRSLCIGVEKIQELACKHDAVCKYHLAGFQKRCDASVKQYLAIAALSARPSEGMLLDLLEDDRFLLRHEACRQIIQEEHNYLVEAPAHLFAYVSAILNVDCDWYMNSVLECSLTSIAYLHMDCFDRLEQAPLKYAMGNIDENLKLLMTDDVDDLLALKWKSLVAMGYEEEVAAGLTLLRESSFSSTLVEQAHASGSMTMRRHPMLETHSLCVRMTLHNCRMLFCHCPLERQLSRLQTLLDKTDQKIANVHKTGPQQMHFRALMKEVNAHKQRATFDPTAVRLSIVKKSSKEYEKLTPAQCHTLRMRASAYNSKKIETLDESRAHIMAQMAHLRDGKQEGLKGGFTNHMDSIRLSSEQFQRFGEMWPGYAAKDDIARLLKPPHGIPLDMRKALDDMSAKLTKPKQQAPNWLAHVVDYREAFSHTGFFADSSHPTGDVIYKLLLPISQPRRAVSLECRKNRRGLSSMTPHGSYEYTAFRFVLHTGVPFKNSSDIWVIPDVRVRRGEVCTAGVPVPFSVWTRFLKQPGPEREEKQPGGSKRTQLCLETLLLLQQEYPWLSLEELQEILKQQVHQIPAEAAGGAGPAQGASSSSGGGREVRPAEELAEDIVAQVHDDLGAIRAEVADAHAGEHSFFRLRALGGEWSVKLFKKLTTDFGSYARDKSVSKWCDKTSFPPAKSYSTNKYGHDNARILAEEMVRLGDHFMSGWIADGSPVPYDFIPLRASYRSTPEYDLWFDDLPLESFSSKAAFEIQVVVPNPLLEDFDMPWRQRR